MNGGAQPLRGRQQAVKRQPLSPVATPFQKRSPHDRRSSPMSGVDELRQVRKAMCAAQKGAQSNLQLRLAAARRMLRYAPANMGPISQIGSHWEIWVPFVKLGSHWQVVAPSGKIRVPSRKGCKTGICSRRQRSPTRPPLAPPAGLPLPP